MAYFSKCFCFSLKPKSFLLIAKNSTANILIGMILGSSVMISTSNWPLLRVACITSASQKAISYQSIILAWAWEDGPDLGGGLILMMRLKSLREITPDEPYLIGFRSNLNLMPVETWSEDGSSFMVIRIYFLASSFITGTLAALLERASIEALDVLK